MMQLATKWNTRQIALELVSYILCFTTILVIVPVAIKGYKFMEYGLGAYADQFKFPPKITVEYALNVFWDVTLMPKLKWLPFTIFGDVLLRRFIYGLRD